MKHNNTTRRFARSLSEAFPAERAAAIERPAPKDHFAEAYVIVLALIALAVWFWAR